MKVQLTINFLKIITLDLPIYFKSKKSLKTNEGVIFLDHTSKVSLCFIFLTTLVVLVLVLALFFALALLLLLERGSLLFLLFLPMNRQEQKVKQ